MTTTTAVRDDPFPRPLMWKNTVTPIPSSRFVIIKM